MSQTAIELKKQQTEDYFTYHPDSVEITVSVSLETFPALFDYAYQSGSRDSGNVKMQTRTPHITFYSDYASLLTARSSVISIEGVTGKTYTVVQVQKDETGGSYQAEAWLV